MTTGKKIAIGIGCGFPLVCCLGGFFVLQATFGGVAGGLDAQLSAARKEGVPLTPEDLNAMTSAKSEENAAPIYQKIFAMADVDKSIKTELDAISNSSGYRAKPEDVAKARKGFSALDTVFPLLTEATKRPKCTWGRDWSKGANVLFPELARMKQLTKILAYRAKMQDERGDWKGALDSIRMAQIVAQHSGNDPILIGLLVDIACESIAFRQFDDLVSNHAKTPGFADAAQKVLDGFGPLPSFRRSLSGEVVMGRATIRQLKSISELSAMSDGGDDETPRASSIENVLFKSPLVQDAFDAKFVEAYREMFKLVPNDPNLWSEAEAGSTQVVTRIDADKSPANTLNRILFPVFSQAAQAVGRLQMHRRLTGTALRLIQDRAKTGRYPEVLPNYGDLRMDPFSTDPLHYRLDGTGFRLYSVGIDRIDDDGKPNDHSNGDKSYDEVITVH